MDFQKVFYRKVQRHKNYEKYLQGGKIEVNELIKINYETEQPTVSARDLHEQLNIEKRFSAWFETNSKGFIENEDFTTVPVSTLVKSSFSTNPCEFDSNQAENLLLISSASCKSLADTVGSSVS